MKRVISNEVKELIRALQKHHSINGKEASLRRLSEIYGISHQTLGNWVDGSKEHLALFAFIEKARKVLELNENQVYKKAIKRQLTKG